ncbi:MAG: BMP family ABC transporter substrate-binding protein [Firmicutes bacterium]|nr:BMP family ABC transporter substrate-binding protein [Bacillota bacterium]
MKKLLVVLMALVLVFAMAACGEKEEQVDTPVALTLENIKIGHVHINDEADLGYSYAHIKAIKNMAANLGLEDSQLIGKYNVTENDAAATAIRELVEAGCNIIFCDSFGHEDYMLEIASEYPEVYFVHATGYQCAGSGLDNVSNFFGNIYEARYLTGIVAGMLTESNHLGYVTAQEYAECISGFTGFYLGALSVNPDVVMDVMYTNNWYDVSLEASVAEALIARGADVLSQHADSTATQTTCAKYEGVYGIGYNSDMSATAPTANIANAVWDWTPAYTYFVETLLGCEGDFTKIATDYSGDLKSGMVDIIFNEELLNTFDNAEEIRTAVATAKQAIIDGTVKVFAGPLYDNEGNVLVAEGDVFVEPASAPSWTNIVKGITVVR